MSNSWRVGCGGAPCPAGAGQSLLLQIRPHGNFRAVGNVRLGIEVVRRAMLAACPPMLLDLLEIATYVYAADQTASRGMPSDLGTKWRRQFRMAVPVRRPDRWNEPELRDLLVGVLGFLAEDDFAFQFAQAPPDPTPAYITVSDGSPFVRPVDEAMTFSGGLDSLAGAAVESIVERRHVLLVQHRSNPKLQPRHDRLVAALVERASRAGGLVTHVPVTVNKSEELTHDSTQRTRSFLFVALAAAVAALVQKRRIRMYENGMVALNLPFSPAVVGARASRTAHPKVLAGFGKLLSAVAGQPFAVENRFAWETRAEVLQRLAAAGCADLIRDSVSCGGTLGMTKGSPHCGVCSQCIDRRFAVLHAGLGAHDPEDGYRIPVLTGDRSDGDPRQVPAAYLDAVARIEKASNPAAFFALFGEAARTLRTGREPAGETARKVFELHRRHAAEVNGVLDAAAREFVPSLRRRELPAGCLLRLVHDNASDPAPQPAPIPRTARELSGLVLDPELLEARRGNRTCTFKNGIEFKLLQKLLQARGAPVSIPDLGAAVWDDRTVDKNVVQAAVSRLRKRLDKAEFGEVTIDGSRIGCYRLTVGVAVAEAG